MDPATTNVPLALERSQSTATVILTPIETWIGRIVAAAAATILEATDEHADRGVTQLTKDQIKERFWTLYLAWQLLILGPWDFDSLARQEGERVLRAADVSPGLARIVIDATMEILRKTIRDTLN